MSQDCDGRLDRASGGRIHTGGVFVLAHWAGVQCGSGRLGCDTTLAIQHLLQFGGRYDTIVSRLGRDRHNDQCQASDHSDQSFGYFHVLIFHFRLLLDRVPALQSLLRRESGSPFYNFCQVLILYWF